MGVGVIFGGWRMGQRGRSSNERNARITIKLDVMNPRDQIRKFKCPLCIHSATRRHNLDTHLRKMHHSTAKEILKIKEIENKLPQGNQNKLQQLIQNRQKKQQWSENDFPDLLEKPELPGNVHEEDFSPKNEHSDTSHVVKVEEPVQVVYEKVTDMIDDYDDLY